MLTHPLREQDGALVLALDGEMDLEHAPVIRKAFLECVAKGKDVILDFSNVGYLDSSGIETLVQADREAKNNGARQLAVMSMPSSSFNSRINAASGVSPAAPILAAIST